MFPPKPDIQTDRHTYRRTDISVYRVASLLNIYVFNLEKHLSAHFSTFLHNNKILHEIQENLENFCPSFVLRTHFKHVQFIDV